MSEGPVRPAWCRRGPIIGLATVILGVARGDMAHWERLAVKAWL